MDECNANIEPSSQIICAISVPTIPIVIIIEDSNVVVVDVLVTMVVEAMLLPHLAKIINSMMIG